MILLTRTQRAQLHANARQSDVDHIPVVKFYNPLGAGVWLATELDEDGDIMFGLADIGYPEKILSARFRSDTAWTLNPTDTESRKA